MDQYFYVLKLRPSLIEKENWTDKDNQIVNNHFEYLKGLEKEGILILAGRTTNLDANTFGIVIIQADSNELAAEYMNSDSAVSGKVMTASLFPYKVALMNQQGILH
jgi:uncharacterized protein